MTRSPRISIPDGVAPAAIGFVYQRVLDRHLSALHTAILRLSAIDDETTEVVRLRSRADP